MLLFEIRWETVIAFPLVALSSPCLYHLQERELAMDNGIICEGGFEELVADRF